MFYARRGRREASGGSLAGTSGGGNPYLYRTIDTGDPRILDGPGLLPRAIDRVPV